jgi:hypothetical protein
MTVDGAFEFFGDDDAPRRRLSPATWPNVSLISLKASAPKVRQLIVEAFVAFVLAHGSYTLFWKA